MAKKFVLNLVPGDVIPPPAHERSWMWRDGVKRMVTVSGVIAGTPDKKGPWLEVACDYANPYNPDQTASSVYRMRPHTLVMVQD